MGVLTVVAVAFLRCRRGVVVPLGLSGHTCGSERSMVSGLREAREGCQRRYVRRGFGLCTR